jgi:3-methyladenine DNA glycosylase AlkC
LVEWLAIDQRLKNDAAKYVQDSVGNWLNDASKTQTNFVIELCKKWEAESKTKETAYIIKKALRTIEK